jgi:hypothetical protein
VNARFLLSLAIAASAVAGCKGSSSRPDGGAGAGAGTGGTAGGAGGGGGAGGAAGASGTAGTGAAAGTGALSGAGGSGGVSGRGGAGGTGGAARGGSGGGAGTGGTRVGCTNHDIDVPAVDVRGSVTIAGMSEVGSSDIGYGLKLITADGDAVLVAVANVASFSSRVIPGAYDLAYVSNGSASTVSAPMNRQSIVRRGVVVAPSGVTVVSADVPTVSVSGLLTVGGLPVLDSSDHATLELINPLDATLFDTLLMGNTVSGSYAVNAVPGTYDLRYISDWLMPYAPGERTPLNNGAIVKRLVYPASGPVTLDIDIPVATVSGVVTVNGAAPTRSNDGMLTLWGRGPGNGVDLGILDIGHAADGQYAVKVIPGTYDLYFQGGGSPRNRFALLRRGIVISAGPTNALDIDIKAATVTGAITIGGVAGGSATDRGAIYLYRGGLDLEDGVLLGYTDASSYTVQVVPGTYDVYYMSDETTVGLKNAPRNKWAKIGGNVVIPATGTTTLNVDVPFATVTGSLTINGASRPTSPANRGAYYLRNASGDEARLAYTNATSYTARIVPGTYDLYYRIFDFAGSPGALPSNGSAKLQAGIVVAPGANVVDVDLPIVTVTGAFTINGAAVSDPDDAGAILLRSDQGEMITIGKTSQLTYSVGLVPGAYDVYYASDGSGVVAPGNGNAKLRCFDVIR